MPLNDMSKDEGQHSSYQSTAILKELGEIKTAQAVSTNEMKNISVIISDIKNDVKEIKADFVNRREHNELVKIVNSQGEQLRNLEYFQIKVMGIATGASVVVYYVLKFIGK